MANDALLVDHEGHAVREQAGEIQDAIGFGSGLFRVAQQRERRAQLLRELAIGFGRVDADSQDLRFSRVELGDISLIRLQLRGSTGSVGLDVKGQHHILLTLKVAEFHGPTALVRQGKVRRLGANLDRRGCGEGIKQN